ncbi:MAG: ferritin-like domain-containing protein [Synergistetes bacterium]|nr:ferritin-like domain-containing protein [Synergistota bacterium]MDW8191639.1 ferritin-like domain-containing protein [Synergistota bacterium]
MSVREEVIKMLNRALELEHAARIQYLAHAELVKGINAEPIIERLKEIASDEQKHEDIFRTLVGSYLGGVPSMGLAEVYEAKDIKEILEVNLKGEKEAIEYYKEIYKKVVENKGAFLYEFETLEHQIRHVIIDEQEHVMELSTLLGL